ncbi:MAG: DUF1307 domain-containing protein [Lachnospiraceae bacterium]|jgi:uncharacterized lipoprotein YehR (DUF1307 family)|nr:DUF1307 domain-containing protein [Lachnospiraceae bacterium]MCI8994765.1 DUF1307 domain-containing protein [Lachnospiraceae bacterium]MCI9133688.1 DUF1307 domain-containing protein [Lachnospiraceae bacterium]
MKKLVSGILISCMALALVACGKEQSATYRSTQDVSGMVITDTMTLDAKGDKVQKMSETIEVDLTAFDDSQYEEVAALYDEMVEQYKSVEGVECTGTSADKVYTISVTVDTTGDAVSELVELGLLSIEGPGASKGISLKKTGEALVASGYEEVTE